MAEFIAGRGTQALSIIGTVLGGLATLGEGSNILGGANGNYASKSDLDNAILLAQKDSTIALLQANSESEKKMIDVYTKITENLNAFKAEQNAWNTSQMINNANISNAVAVNQSSIAALQGMTKLVIPITNVCPQPAVATTTTTENSGSGTGGT